MTSPYAWLPPIEELSSHGGDWDRYLAAIYAIFHRDFVQSLPTFKGRRVGLKRHPVSEGKDATFWHFTSEGDTEAERTPDLRRCERIGWPRPTIENSDDGGIKTWVTERRHERRIVLWLEHEDYVLILADRGEYVLPWTAYVVEQDHRRRKLQREYQAYVDAIQKG